MKQDNNIPQGYKQTELGIIPEDWNIKSIGEFLSIGNGHDYKGKSFGNIPVYGTGGIITHIDDYLYDGQTICIGRKGTIDKPIFHSGKIWTVDTLYYTYNFIDIEVKFIYYLLLTIDWMSLNEATGVPSLTSDRIKQITLALPPIAEQRAIAEALSNVDGLIAALDKKIAKKRLLKQGAMQQLLTGKKRLPGFTDEWVEKPIRLLCKLYGRIGFRGYTKADLVHKGEGAITFSPSDIHEQVISYTNCDYISWRKYDESPEIQVFNGDIIFCKTASIGKCAIIKNLPEKATINPQFVVLKDFKCNNEWLYYSIIDRKFQTVVSGITGGSTIPTMSQEKLYEQTLLCPPTIEEQQAIATILSDMDKEIADLEAQRDKYRLLKSGMMQKLLTGQIRLKTE